MTSLWIGIDAAWVLCCFGLAVALPASVLGRSRRDRVPLRMLGPALVWTWLAMAALVPLLASVHALNWATALIVCGAVPLVAWTCRHAEAPTRAATEIVRAVAFRLIDPRSLSRMTNPGPGALVLCALPAVPLLWILAGGFDVRLPVPLDMDTLWRTRQILGGSPLWDPTAALTAVLTSISVVDALVVAAAMRIALVALALVLAEQVLADAVGRHWWTTAPICALAAFAPWAPLATWGLALAILVGLASVLAWHRDHDRADAWHALAAAVLAAGLAAPLPGESGVLAGVARAPHFLDTRSAAEQVVQLSRTTPPAGSLVVGTPVQRLEIDGSPRFMDLLEFVRRYQDRAGDPQFRFDPGPRRLIVFVERQLVASAPGTAFLAAQAPVYQVPHERLALGARAGEICDAYRRTHQGAHVIYDSRDLRIYRIDLS